MGSFRSFDSCTILENSVYYAWILVHLGHFHRCNLAEFIYATQVQTGSWGFYLPYSPKKLTKLWRGNTCFVFNKKSSELLFFLILFSAGIYLFKVWLKGSQNGYIFFLFLFSSGIYLFRFYFKGEHFFSGGCILLAKVIITCRSKKKTIN